MMTDLVLDWEGGERNDQNVPVILPNIQGQRYVFGSDYPGGKEFFFCRNEKVLIDSTQFVIRVDEQGQYWIQMSDTVSSAKFKTFVNSERLLEPRLLGRGDMVFLEDADIRNGYRYVRRRHHFFQVKERVVPAWSGLEIEGAGADSDSDSEGCKAMAMNEPDSEDGANAKSAESPLDNELVLEKIISYLPVKDLRNARLVCKKWRDEAFKPLEKRGIVSFYFTDYLNPEYSSRVFRYLHEMKGLKIRNLRIFLSTHDSYRRTNTSEIFPSSPGICGPKKLDDLRKLLKSSHNFSTLFLSCERFCFASSEFVPFLLIFQELGEKLVELELTFYDRVFPVHLPQLPVMTNLKKFTHYGRLGYILNPRWVFYFVPLFSNNLEHFTCPNNMAEGYLQEFLEHPTPNLKGIILKDEASVTTLSALLELETPLISLEIRYSKPCTEVEELLESLFLKNSKSLQHLVIRIGNGYGYASNSNPKDPEIKFPSFPKLEVLEVEYGHAAKVCWDTELDYKKHFPSLRKLTVRPPEPWNEDDQIFEAFFPRKWELRCETLAEVWVPVLRKQNVPCYEPQVSLESFQLQSSMDRIKMMFPSAGKINFLQETVGNGLR